MKKIFYLFLVICCLSLAAGILCACGPEEEAESVARVDGFVLQLSEDEKSYFVAGYEGAGGDLIVPSEYGKKPVTTIGEAAFKGNSSINSVTLPASVVSIGKESFMECTGITSFAFSENLVSIGDAAFKGDTGICALTLPASVVSIGSEAFAGCTSLTSVPLPNGLADIGERAFRGCAALTSVIIPDGVTSVKAMTFADCSGLDSVTFGSRVTRLEDMAFSGCSALTSLVIPDGVTYISFSVFESCTALTSVALPDSIEHMGDGVFNGCNGIQSATLPASLADSIPGSALTEVIITGGESIGSNAFKYASRLRSVALPEGITMIGPSAFSDCTALTEIALPQSLEIISADAFNGCTSLGTITIPENVTHIGERAFEDCKALTNINWNAVSVADFTVLGHVFDSAGTAGAGLSLTIGDDVQSIPAYMFYAGAGILTYPANLVSVTVGEGVTDIGEGAFRKCDKLASVQMGEKVQRIGNKVFEGCEALSSLTLPASLLSIGQQAFYDTGLTSVSFEQPLGWQVSSSSSFEEPQAVSSAQLSAPASAAVCLTRTYSSWYWKQA